METKSAKERYWNDQLEFLNKRPLLGTATTILDMKWMEDVFNNKEEETMDVLCLRDKQHLPNKESILLIFYFFRNKDKSLKNIDIASKVLVEIKKYWAFSNIPTQHDWWAKRCILDLNTKYLNILKNLKVKLSQR